jgi:hypothetical protein
MNNGRSSLARQDPRVHRSTDFRSEQVADNNSPFDWSKIDQRHLAERFFRPASNPGMVEAKSWSRYRIQQSPNRVANCGRLMAWRGLRPQPNRVFEKNV